MKLAYDLEVNALVVELAEGAVEHTVEVGLGTLADLDAGGHVLSIEVLNPGRRWPLERVLERFALGPSDRAMLTGIWASRLTLDLCELAPLPAG
ncbi:MAG: DUF2283 domain-containing protein [Thermoleophilia bacterium]|nr:DUF2283 domain-containing protein [Thermoleophilia bacterium]